MEPFRTFVDLVAVTSGFVAVAQFLAPQSFLDQVDRALVRAHAWLHARRYENFRQRMAANAYDRRILQVGIVLLFINGVTSCAFKLATTPHFSENIVQFFILQIFVFIFSTAAFYRFGIPLVKWIFTGRTVWTTIVKTALALIIASGAGLVTFLIGFTTAQRAASSPQLDSMVQIYFVLGTAFGFPYGVLFIVSCFLIVAMTAFLTNGVVSTVLVFYLYFVAFMWVAWVLVSTIAFVLTRSFERKGLAVFLAAISTFLSALMQYKGH